MKYIKEITYTVIIIAILILLGTWFKDKIITLLGGYTDKDSITVTNTEYIKGKVDTTAVFNHYVETRGIILNPKPVIEYKYKYIDPVSDTEIVEDSIKSFNVKIKDSLLDGTFHLVNNFKGDLLYSKFNYKPLFPKYITRVDTLRITTNTTSTLTNKRTLLGAGIGYNNLQFLSVLGSYTNKTNWQFIYEYGKSLEDTKLIINDGGAFKTSSGDLHSFKIIKHF